MDLKLRILQGKNAGQEVTITGHKFLIGRAEDCHLRPGSEMISRHHCAIVIDQTYVAIRDFGSKNGTYVNGERVAGECELKSGDQLRVGPLEFEISMRQGELGGPKKPPVNNPKEAAERTAAGLREEQDPSQWLSDPALPALSTVDSQVTASVDTQSIRLSETEQISLTRTQTFVGTSPLAMQPQPAVPAHAAPAHQTPVQAAPAYAAPTHAPQPTAVQPIAAAAPAVQPIREHAAHTVVAMPVVAAAVAPVAPPAPATPAAVASAAAAPAPPANAPKRPLPSTFQMPEPEEAAQAGEDKSGKAKKVYGKLPTQKGPENSRSAAADMLDKMRRHR